MVFLEFEKPLEVLYEKLEKIKQVGADGEIDVTDMVVNLEKRIAKRQKEIFTNLTPWQRVQLSRHPDRPYTLFYINHICKKFTELHGDRKFKDDKAMVGGIGSIDGQTVVIIGQQKGTDTKMRQFRNFGMANPEGYRKALRLMKLAERFGFPVITLIDTPGAFPGIEAEERGQAEAIARNLFEMAQLKVPILSYVIGEGASGGAIGIGLGDRVFMLENTWYSVISPENCSTILWRNWDHKIDAADALKLTANDMFKTGIVDGIVKEPMGGAHTKPEEMCKMLKRHIKKQLNELMEIPTEQLIEQRIDKYANIGVYEQLETKEL